VVQLHANPDLAADLTLQRGRIILTGPGGMKSLRARVRIDNTMNPSLPEVWDIDLERPGTEVLVDVWHGYLRDEPFYKNPKDPSRVGPFSAAQVFVRKGSINLHHDALAVRMDENTSLSWDSRTRAGNPMPLGKKTPDWATGTSELPPNLDAKLRERLQTARKDMQAARDSLAKALSGRGDKVDVALQDVLKEGSPPERLLVVRCYAALDDLPHLLDALADPERPEVRLAAVEALRSWIAEARDNDYRLLEQLGEKYTQGESAIILTLLHTFTAQAAAQRETYETLIAYLTNRQLVIRELAHWHLIRMAPREGMPIRYSASAPQEQLRAAQQQWTDLLQSGKLPPRPPQGSGPPGG
jgi:hypothetical protein